MKEYYCITARKKLALLLLILVSALLFVACGSSLNPGECRYTVTGDTEMTVKGQGILDESFGIYFVEIYPGTKTTDVQCADECDPLISFGAALVLLEGEHTLDPKLQVNFFPWQARWETDSYIGTAGTVTVETFSPWSATFEFDGVFASDPGRTINVQGECYQLKPVVKE